MRDDPPRRAPERFHGRIRDGHRRTCSHNGCSEAGDFRAPRSRTPERDGYDHYCLEHIRAFNAAWDFFKGLSREEIEAEQKDQGHPSWVRDSWPFATNVREAYGHPYGPGQTGPHLDDPLSLLQGKAARRAGASPAVGPTGVRLAERDRQALEALALVTEPLPDLRAIRRAYKALVRRFHPDMNGGDRRHEAQLRKVIDAYTHLSSSPAFVAPTG